MSYLMSLVSLAFRAIGLKISTTVVFDRPSTALLTANRGEETPIKPEPQTCNRNISYCLQVIII